MSPKRENSQQLLRPGQAVIIAGAAGVCYGRVLHVETPATLPTIHGAPELARVQAILAKWDIGELALIEHLHDGRPISFFALRHESGAWRDLHGQPLTITPNNNPC